MEIGLREWLIVGAIIVILLIIIDGWRRMRAQSNSLKIDIDDKLADLGDDNYNPELPVGTARVFKPKDGDGQAAKGAEASTTEQPTSNSEFKSEEKPRDAFQAVPETIEEQISTEEAPDPLMSSAEDVKAFAESNSQMEEQRHLDQQQESQSPLNSVEESTLPSQSTDNSESYSTNYSDIDDADTLSVPRVVGSEHKEQEQETNDTSIDQTSTSNDNSQPGSGSIDLDKTSETNDHIGFSAFGSDREAAEFNESIITQLDTEDHQERATDIALESDNAPLVTQNSDEPVSSSSQKVIEENTADVANSFTVPDILKKNHLVVDENSQAGNAPSFQSAVDTSSSAEQVINELNEQLSSEVGEVKDTPTHKENTNLAAATDHTDSIVNSLLRDRALSKQEKAPEIDTFNSQEITNESILKRQEAVEEQAPSRSEINLGPDKFEKLLAEREKEGFLSRDEGSAMGESESHSIEQFNETDTVQVSSQESSSQHNDFNQDVDSDLTDTMSDSPKASEYSRRVSDFAQHDFDDQEDGDSGHNLIPNPFQPQKLAAEEDSKQVNQVDIEAPIAVDTASDQVPLDPQSEIEALKARLKALDPDQFQALEENSIASSDIKDPEESDSLNEAEEFLADQQLDEAEKNSEEAPGSVEEQDSLEENTAPRSENFEQIIAQLDEQIAQQATTVIDDDVNLEDLDDNITQLDDTAHQLEQEEAEHEGSNTIAFDQQADPLMDSLKNESAADDLMAQFEHDLELDQQAVSNELDRPISEILKNQQAQQPSSEQTLNQNGISDELTEVEEQDVLLSKNQEPVLSESLLMGENFDDSDEPDSSQQLDDGIDHAADLGFSAVEQDYQPKVAVSDDPLMVGFEDDFEQTENEESVEPSSESAQKSLFNDHELAAVSKVEAPEITKSKAAKKPRKAIANVDDPNVVLIVTVVAKDQYLNGAALRRVVEACGMEFGDMKVFHRFEDGVDQGAVQFSMVNAINPGTFDIVNMDDTSTPGVSFFMSMDEPVDPKNALECMMATAETVATHLNGDLLDDDRSVLRPQTKEHYRERVRIHELNKLRQRAL